MNELEDIEIAILKAVAKGGVTEIPDESQDSGHTGWLVQQGYVTQEAGGLVLTEKGRLAIESR